MNDALDLSIIGKRQPRLDGFEKVSGRSVFTDDVELPGMLYGKIFRSPHARARIKRIDTSKARALPGVKAVLVHDDMPDLAFQENQPIFAQDMARYVGEEIAAVAAIDRVTAEEAIELIDVEFEPLEAVTTLRDARKDGAPLVHGQSPGNVALTYNKDYGDPDGEMAKSDVVVTDEFKSPVQHNCLAEFHIAVADFSRPDKLVLWTPTQSSYMYQSGLARGFGLTESQVQIKYLNVGGAFTGRGTPRIHHFVAAALSRAAARPVKLRASGDEEFIMYRGSGETQFKYKVGLEKSGRIKALDVDISYDCGAHAEYKLILFSPAVYLNWLYGLDAVRFKGRFIYTNNIPRASHHGGIFARMSAGWMQHLTHAAEKLGIDPVGFHLMNAIGPGHRALDGADFASCGLKQCIETVAARSGWKQKYGKLPPFKGIGIGIGVMSSGTKHPGRHDTSAAMIKIAEDGIVTLYTGIPDMGQGSHTAMGMIAAECLGITTDRLRIVAGDSEIAPFDMGAFSQRGTFTTGRAVLAACDDAKRQMMDAAKAELGSADVVFRNNTVFARGAPDKAVPLAKLVRATTMRKDGQYVMGRGSYNSPRESGSLAYSFGAQVAEVEIDPESGVVRVEKITLAHDIGRAINPLAVEGQLDGQVFSGVSQILYEECRVEDGQTLNPSRLEYKLPRTYELPKLDYSIIETIDPHGPFGAKEVGEGPVIVTMSAVACAVANALGGMMPEIPMTPWRVLRAIRQRKLDSAA